ncbi:MAG: TetR family transcriptional regulator [Candidatus Saccharibacteria bacterium]|nr:TetR family transcriptional regulator [Microbacteriaceae bacterium]
MIPASQNAVGRPRASSRAVIEGAAAGLFLEDTYALTTIEHITQRAGVSRNTFFNYFDAKSDVLWVELDAAIDRLSRELQAVPRGRPALEEIRAATIRVVSDIGVDRVPLALTQDDVMGTAEETRVSGLARLARRSDLIADFLAGHLLRSPDDLLVLSAANALSGAISAAWTVWARDGIGRRPLAEYMSEAFDVVSNGLEFALGTTSVAE